MTRSPGRSFLTSLWAVLSVLVSLTLLVALLEIRSLGRRLDTLGTISVQNKATISALRDEIAAKDRQIIQLGGTTVIIRPTPAPSPRPVTQGSTPARAPQPTAKATSAPRAVAPDRHRGGHDDAKPSPSPSPSNCVLPLFC